MKLNIILICQYGASTSILAENILKSASSRGIEATCNAYSEQDLGSVIDGADIVLGGPQIRFLADDLRKEFADKNVPIEIIDAVDYGMMNGEKVLDFALKSIENHNQK